MSDISKHDEFRELRLLISQALDGTLSREGIERMDSMLESGSHVRLYYREYMAMYCDLSNLMGCHPIESEEMSRLQDEEFWALLADYEKNAPMVEPPQPPRERKLIDKVQYPPREKSSLSKFSIFSFAVTIAAMVLIAVFVRFAPPKGSYEAATLTDSLNARWADRSSPFQNETRFLANDGPLLLREGLVKLLFDSDVQVVIEGPAEFQILGKERIDLRYGKIFASVPTEAIGFTIRTQNTEVVDLGTAFGVLGHIDGNTEVHMFTGKVNIFAGDRHQLKTSRLLTAGNALRIDSRNSEIQDIVLNEHSVVREIDSGANLIWRGENVLRLTDLILGGNGFGTALRRSIEFDPQAGTAVTSGLAGYRSGPGVYIPIAESPYLDGLFVPGSGDTKPVISSAGHTFRECPETTGLYYSNIVCLKDWRFFDPLENMFEAARKQYSDSGVLYLHSNIGVTLDLDAMRRLVPGFRIVDFRAFAGIIRMGDNEPDHSEADVWVLVDGQLRSSRQGLGADQGYEIQVALSEHDRFLTLVVTDGGKVYAEGFPANHFDTCGFAEPVLGLIPRD